jgi:MurNAc alpha-1-phosphate uridylyltransferase
MILAAGRGERMKPLTDHTPKPLLKLAGKALIEYHLERLALAGFDEIVINHAWLGHQIEDTLKDGANHGVRISYSAEAEALETAGGIIKALPMLGSAPFLLVNGDIWTDYPFARLRKKSLMQELAHLVLVDNPPQHPEGDYQLRADKRLYVGESEGSKALTYSGIAVINPQLLEGIQESKLALAPVWEARMPDGRITGEYYSGQWFDIGTVGRLKKLEAMLRAKPQPASTR